MKYTLCYHMQEQYVFSPVHLILCHLSTSAQGLLEMLDLLHQR